MALTVSIEDVYFKSGAATVFDCFQGSPENYDLGTYQLFTQGGDTPGPNESCILHIVRITYLDAYTATYTVTEKTITPSQPIIIENQVQLYDENIRDYNIPGQETTKQWQTIAEGHFYQPDLLLNNTLKWNCYIIGWRLRDNTSAWHYPDQRSLSYIQAYIDSKVRFRVSYPDNGGGGPDPRVDCILHYLSWGLGSECQAVQKVTLPRIPLIAHSVIDEFRHPRSIAYPRSEFRHPASVRTWKPRPRPKQPTISPHRVQPNLRRAKPIGTSSWRIWTRTGRRQQSK